MATLDFYTSSYFDNSSVVPFSPSNNVVPIYVLVLSIASCCLSLIGIFCIFVSYVAIVTIRNYIRKLLIFLTIANLIHVLGIIIGIVRYMLLEFTDEIYQKERQVCLFQSVVVSFAPCSSFFWTVFIAIYFQVQILRPSWAQKLSSKQATVAYHVVSWGVPGLTCILALYFKVFGDTEDIFTGPWCWIKTNPERKTAILWMILTVKGWELLSYLVLAEVLVFVVYKTSILPRCLRRRGGQYLEIHDSNVQTSTGLRRGDKNFVFIWLIFYVLRFAGTFRFLLHVTYGPLHEQMRITDRVMLAWQAFGDTAQAFVNFICLCVFDRVIRQHYCSRLSRNDRNDQMANNGGEQGINM
ncbi:G-protein coupled receptor 157-like [Ruditapes philippinarum]|uniref:G-protein coupled receptor 157-like n=1 Tax=Ruditapes philippinarum TaxID=129788 RepID=UPI00295C1934|nr:G-protein coupled receptor 157-like [Ruditapes philippinarum]